MNTAVGIAVDTATLKEGTAEDAAVLLLVQQQMQLCCRSTDANNRHSSRCSSAVEAQHMQTADSSAVDTAADATVLWIHEYIQQELIQRVATYSSRYSSECSRSVQRSKHNSRYRRAVETAALLWV